MLLQSLFLACILCAYADPQPPAQRTFNIQVNQLQLQIWATYQNGTYQDQYQFEMDLNQQNQDIFKAFFQYHAQGAKNQSQIQFHLEVTSLVEFNGTDIYEGDAKTIRSQWPAGKSVQWHYWVNETKIVDNVPIYSYSSTTLDGIFTVRLHTSAAHLNLPDSPALSPNNIKLDLEVHNYPYMASSSRLALLTKVTGQSQSVNSGQGAVNDNNLLFGAISSDLPFGSFSWINQALPIPSNKSFAVVAYSPDESASNSVDLYFTFCTPPSGPRPTSIIWDPRIGLDYAAADVLCLGTLCGPGAIAVIVVIVVATTTIITIGIACAILKKKQRPYQVIQ